MLARTGAGLIFPVGHYMGPFHPARGVPANHHVARVGWKSAKLPDQAHVDVWLLAHGVADQVEAPWTREAIAEAAHGYHRTKVHDIIDSLLSLGLLTVVRSGTDQAVEFAYHYRIRPLLVGLGNEPENPARTGIGLPGLAPLLEVDASDFEIWQWAHLWPNIWSACEGLAQAGREAGGGSSSNLHPASVLASMIRSMRTLLAKNAIYLDTASAR